MSKYMGRAYLTLQGYNDKNETLRVIKDITPSLENMASNGILWNYVAQPLYDEGSILDEGLDPEEILLFTENRFPVVICNIAITIPINEVKEKAIKELEQEFGLQLFKSWTGVYHLIEPNNLKHD